MVILEDNSQDDGYYVTSRDFRDLNFFRQVFLPISRWSLFVIYFWFGALKVVGESPITPLVDHLFQKTLSFIMPFGVFIVLFGLFECLIGILFLIRGGERVALFMFFAHMLLTALPLFLLPEEIWKGFLALTLEGQFIIKNLALVSAALAVGTSIRRRETY